MLSQDALKWKGKFITKKSGPYLGRKAKVMFVGEGTNGNGYMTIAYLDTQRFCYECNPDNYLLWEEFQKKGYASNSKQIAKYLLKISSRREKFGIKIGDKVYVIIRAEDHIPYLIMQILLEQKVLHRAGTLSRFLRAHNQSYKDFYQKMWDAKKPVPNQNVPLYEVLIPIVALA